MNYIIKTICDFFESKHNRRDMMRGFTIVELLVVVAIVSLLISLVIVGFSSIQQKSRDVRRAADIDVFVKALNLYNNDFSAYPIYDGYINGGDILSVALLNSGVLKSVPLDPTNQEVNGIIYKYDYFSDGISFQIQYCMETDSVLNVRQGCENYARP